MNIKYKPGLMVQVLTVPQYLCFVHSQQNVCSTYVISEVPCKGNGITLGLTSGNTNYAGLTDQPSFGLTTGMSSYGKSVGVTAATDGTAFAGKTIGVTTDGSKSGIVADLSSIATFAPTFCIKY